MHDFFFAFDQLELGTPLSKFQKNLAAIRLARTCADENRPATPEEQAVLACYSGWGDAAVLRYLGESAELQTLLSAEELRAARGSSLNAHYTALPVVDAIWSGLIHLGLGNLPNLRVLDPSAGVGHFKSRIPAVLRSNADAQRSDLAAFEAQWVEIELDLITARILRLLHPGSKI
jgi:hypothetical protein